MLFSVYMYHLNHGFVCSVHHVNSKAACTVPVPVPGSAIAANRAFGALKVFRANVAIIAAQGKEASEHLGAQGLQGERGDRGEQGLTIPTHKTAKYSNRPSSSGVGDGTVHFYARRSQTL